MPTERFRFSSSGGHQLAAALDLPEREPLAYTLFAHCFTCGKDVLAARRIAGGRIFQSINSLKDMDQLPKGTFRKRVRREEIDFKRRGLIWRHKSLVRSLNKPIWPPSLQKPVQ
jgi:hypothetical protein